MLTIQTNVDEFNRTLKEYVALRKRSTPYEVNRKAKDISLRLAGYRGQRESKWKTFDPVNSGSGIFGVEGGGFFDVKANPEKIQRDAESRGWEIRRKPDQFTPTERGVSKRVEQLAREMLEGQKSQLFKVSQFGIYPLRFSRANKGVRALAAGRFGGEKWRVRGRGFHMLSEEQQEKQRSKLLDSDKRLNFRAIANFLEVRFRKRAAFGGLLRSQWLFKRWRPAKLATGATNGNYKQLSYDGREMADVTITEGGVTIRSKVPGTSKFPGVIAKVLSEGAADMREYIARKWREDALKSFKASLFT